MIFAVFAGYVSLAAMWKLVLPGTNSSEPATEYREYTRLHTFSGTALVTYAGSRMMFSHLHTSERASVATASSLLLACKVLLFCIDIYK